MMGAAAFLMIVAIGLLSAAGQYLLKVGLSASVGGDTGSTVPALMIRLASNPHLMLAALLYVVAFGIYGFLLVKSDVSQIFPAAIGINIFCVALMAGLTLGEALTGPRLLGMAAIAAGVYVVSRF
jgi:hypothetical protein